MARDFLLPDLGEGLTEAEIRQVLVREGDVVREDAPLLEVETDKATVEIPSPMGGRVEKIHVRPGQTVKVGQVLVSFGDGAAPPTGRQVADTLDPTRKLAPEARTVVEGGARQAPHAPADAPPRREGPVPATPSTRRLARELGVELRAVYGSGPGGRVTDDDVRAAAVAATLIPHVTHFDRADITDLDALIQRNLEVARGRGVTLTLTSFLLKAVALSLREHPHFNTSLDPAAGELIVKRYVHLGVAVAMERGLIVPVIRDVDQKPLLELQRELGALAQRVRDGKATLEDLRGGTFTVTNIGALGGTGAIPIINYPEVAILGVARAREEAAVRDGD